MGVDYAQHKEFIKNSLRVVKGVISGKENYIYNSLGYLGDVLSDYYIYLDESKLSGLVENCKKLLPVQYSPMIDSYVNSGDIKQLIMLYMQTLTKLKVDCDFIKNGVEESGSIQQFLVNQGVPAEVVAEDLQLKGEDLKSIGLLDPEEERQKQIELEKQKQLELERQKEAERLAKEQAEKEKAEEARRLELERIRKAQLEEERARQAKIEEERRIQAEKEAKEKEELERLRIKKAEEERLEKLKREEEERQKALREKLQKEEILAKENKEKSNNLSEVDAEKMDLILQELNKYKSSNESLTKTVEDLKSMITDLMSNLQKSNVIEPPEPMTPEEMEHSLELLLNGSDRISFKMLQPIADAYSEGFKLEVTNLMKELFSELEKGGVNIG